MRNAYIPRHQVEASFDGLDLDFDAVQAGTLDVGPDLDLVQFERGFDALMESVEYELSPEALSEVYDNKVGALSVAWKARREASRALRSLPLDVDVFDEAA